VLCHPREGRKGRWRVSKAAERRKSVIKIWRQSEERGSRFPVLQLLFANHPPPQNLDFSLMSPLTAPESPLTVLCSMFDLERARSTTGTGVYFALASNQQKLDGLVIHA